MNYCNFASFNTEVHTKTCIIQMGPNVLYVGYKMNVNQKHFVFLISQNALADLKGPKGKNIICTMDDVRETFQGRHTAQYQLQ